MFPQAAPSQHYLARQQLRHTKQFTAGTLFTARCLQLLSRMTASGGKRFHLSGLHLPILPKSILHIYFQKVAFFYKNETRVETSKRSCPTYNSKGRGYSAPTKPEGAISKLVVAILFHYFDFQTFYHSHISPPPRGLTSDEMRERIALELITTEYEYVNDLYTLVCAKNEMEQFIHKNELSSIFNSILVVLNTCVTILTRKRCRGDL